jgi:hypothetical protein
MATSGIQHNVDAQETKQPQNKRRRLARDGESHAEWPQTASEFKAAGVRGEQSAPSGQHGSRFGGFIAAGSHSYIHQGNTIVNHIYPYGCWPADNSNIAFAESRFKWPLGDGKENYQNASERTIHQAKSAPKVKSYPELRKIASNR